MSGPDSSCHRTNLALWTNFRTFSSITNNAVGLTITLAAWCAESRYNPRAPSSLQHSLHAPTSGPVLGWHTPPWLLREHPSYPSTSSKSLLLLCKTSILTSLISIGFSCTHLPNVSQSKIEFFSIFLLYLEQCLPCSSVLWLDIEAHVWEQHAVETSTMQNEGLCRVTASAWKGGQPGGPIELTPSIDHCDNRAKGNMESFLVAIFLTANKIKWGISKLCPRHGRTHRHIGYLSTEGAGCQSLSTGTFWREGPPRKEAGGPSRELRRTNWVWTWSIPLKPHMLMVWTLAGNSNTEKPSDHGGSDFIGTWKNGFMSWLAFLGGSGLLEEVSQCGCFLFFSPLPESCQLGSFALPCTSLSLQRPRNTVSMETTKTLNQNEMFFL